MLLTSIDPPLTFGPNILTSSGSCTKCLLKKLNKLDDIANDASAVGCRQCVELVLCRQVRAT